MDYPFHNKRIFQDRRRELRKKSTETEDIMWQCLRNRNLGAKFRRQYSIGNYIVDFYCPEAKLIIEIDGEIHEFNREYDNIREKFFKDLNYLILSFTNKDIEENLPEVLELIKKYL